jgi:hypothetical protein
LQYTPQTDRLGCGHASQRTNTVRTALSNVPRQNRMGLALAETARTGTPEQQAAFAAAFTKGADGQYSMNADVRDTPSNAARFFGTMFNNDASALRNALERARRHAGLDVRVTPQVLRRSFNTLLKDGGITPEAIQAMMGHARDGQMTERYYYAAESVKRAAVVDLEARIAGGRR